jgi:hypothetical protein
MMRKIAAGAALLATAIALSACVVAPAPGYAGGPGCHWVPGHYGPWGGWHPGPCA